MIDQTLKEFIQAVIVETKQVRSVPISMSISTLNSSSLTDQITKIRAIKGVITVGIDRESQTASSGHKMMYVTLKFLPPPGDVYEYVDALGAAVKGAGGVEIVHIYKMGGYDIKRPNGDPLIY